MHHHRGSHRVIVGRLEIGAGRGRPSLRRRAPARAAGEAAQPARRGQRGFTLIEMVIVMAILGILAGIVTISMEGVVGLARKRAMEGEQMEVQSAMNFMVMDRQVDVGDACAQFPGATSDMTQFPSGQQYPSPGASPVPAGTPVALYPHYLRKRWLMRAYVCVGPGTVQPAP